MKPTNWNAKASWPNTVSFLAFLEFRGRQFDGFIFVFADDLIAAIKQVKTLLMEKADPSISRSQQEITDELDNVVSNALSKSYSSNIYARALN